LKNHVRAALDFGIIVWFGYMVLDKIGSLAFLMAGLIIAPATLSVIRSPYFICLSSILYIHFRFPL